MDYFSDKFNTRVDFVKTFLVRTAQKGGQGVSPGAKV
jgi:hypothetical protein